MHAAERPPRMSVQCSLSYSQPAPAVGSAVQRPAQKRAASATTLRTGIRRNPRFD